MVEKIIDKIKYQDYLIHKIFWLIIGILIVLTAIAFYFGFELGKKAEGEKYREINLPKAAVENRQIQISASPEEKIVVIPPSQEIKFLDGEILSIDLENQKIIFKITGPSHIFAELKKYSSQRTTILTNETKIIELLPLKSQQEIRLTKKTDLIPLMGSYYKKIYLNPADLKTGDLISLIADKDIKTKEQFEALEIRLLKKSQINE